jgi:putative ABC transport system substrate-binding protein
MRRRAFISLLGGAAAAWPLAARAQQGERMRRIGVLVPQDQDSPVAQARIAALLQELQRLGWTGRNVRIDIRWAGAEVENIRKHAAELAALAPDVILANGSVVVTPLLQATRTVPIVFVVVPDPVGAGFVDSLARPGGNATGFVQFEYGLSGKWLELLKEVAPRLTRAAVLRDAAIPAGTGQFGAIQSVAPSVGLEVSPVNIRDASEIERAVTPIPILVRVRSEVRAGRLRCSLRREIGARRIILRLSRGRDRAGKQQYAGHQCCRHFASTAH